MVEGLAVVFRREEFSGDWTTHEAHIARSPHTTASAPLIPAHPPQECASALGRPGAIWQLDNNAATVTEHFPFEGLLFSRGPRAPGRPRPRGHTPLTGRSYPDTGSSSTLPSPCYAFRVKVTFNTLRQTNGKFLLPPTHPAKKQQRVHFQVFTSTRRHLDSPLRGVSARQNCRAPSPAQRRRSACFWLRPRYGSRSGVRDRRRSSGDRERGRRRPLSSR